jgi:hypothetical protein
MSPSLTRQVVAAVGSASARHMSGRIAWIGMKRYRLLMVGRNYLIQMDGKPQKHSFQQQLVLQADGPKQARQMAIARLRLDAELGAMTLNEAGDPPEVDLDTLWEMDILDDPEDVPAGRTFYIEKRWWQFWK